METKPFDCNVNQKNLSEISGYLSCLADLSKFVKERGQFPSIDTIELLDTIISTNSVISSILKEAKESPYYTMDMVDKEDPNNTPVASEDALLMDNPVFEINYTQDIINRLNEQLGLKP